MHFMPTYKSPQHLSFDRIAIYLENCTYDVWIRSHHIIIETDVYLQWATAFNLLIFLFSLFEYKSHFRARSFQGTWPSISMKRWEHTPVWHKHEKSFMLEPTIWGIRQYEVSEMFPTTKLILILLLHPSEQFVFQFFPDLCFLPLNLSLIDFSWIFLYFMLFTDLAKQHADFIDREALCKVPRPRVISIPLHPSQSYMPPCTILHRCNDDTGCCKSHTLKCVPKQYEIVTLYFIVSILSR